MTGREPPTGARDRITRHVVDRIIAGEWRPGDRIPSEQALTTLFGVSRMTAHHALRDLAARGFLSRRAGSGTFVAEPGAYVTEYRHLDIIDEIGSRGGRHRAEMLRRELRPATPDEAAAFAIETGSTLFHAIVLHHEDGIPLELEDRLIAPRFLPDAMTIDLARRTMFFHLMLVRPGRAGSETLRAIIGTAAEAALLHVDSATPMIELVRKTWSTEGVVTVARMLRPGDGVRLEGVIRSLGPYDRSGPSLPTLP